MKRFKIVNGRAVKTTTETLRTWWNGQPADAQRVRVVVGAAVRDSLWYAKLAGQERAAVRVDYQGERFYLDNENGSAWDKVTLGRGSPKYGHSSLAVEREVGS